jgi:quinol monooxygenase YgiN
MLSIPAVGSVFDFANRVTDEQLAALSASLAQRGWLLYPLISDAPYADVVRFSESFADMGDDEIDSWMTNDATAASRDAVLSGRGAPSARGM